MALRPGSDPRESSEPPDYQEDHPEEDPRQWGWHGQWGRGSRIGGWVVAALLVLLLTATNYQWEYRITLLVLALLLVLTLLVDRRRRDQSWRL